MPPLIPHRDQLRHKPTELSIVSTKTTFKFKTDLPCRRQQGFHDNLFDLIGVVNPVSTARQHFLQSAAEMVERDAIIMKCTQIGGKEADVLGHNVDRRPNLPLTLFRTEMGAWLLQNLKAVRPEPFGQKIGNRLLEAIRIAVIQR